MYYDALREMYHEFIEKRLEVILIPQREPANVGACIRVASQNNCRWYRELCADFPSRRTRQYRKFKTKIKRRYITDIMERLLAGKKSKSAYADWITRYARNMENNITREMGCSHA